MILSAANLESVPKQVAMATATAWLCSFTTAWRTLITGGGPRPSETALIIDASGGTGHAGLLMADCIGTETYTMTFTD